MEGKKPVTNATSLGADRFRGPLSLTPSWNCHCRVGRLNGTVAFPKRLSEGPVHGLSGDANRRRANIDSRACEIRLDVLYLYPLKTPRMSFYQKAGLPATVRNIRNTRL